MDKVIVRELKLETIIGLYPWERIARQTLLVDLSMATDIREAAAHDELKNTIDYSAVCAAVAELADAGRFKLIETFAEKIAEMIQRRFSVCSLRVAVYKIDVLTNVKCVGIEIERGRMPQRQTEKGQMS